MYSNSLCVYSHKLKTNKTFEIAELHYIKDPWRDEYHWRVEITPEYPKKTTINFYKSKSEAQAYIRGRKRRFIKLYGIPTMEVWNNG